MTIEMGITEKYVKTYSFHFKRDKSFSLKITGNAEV